MDSPKRLGGEGDVEDEAPKKMVKSAPRKVLKTKAGSENEPKPASASTIRMVVAGELLYDGDESLEFADQPPELPEVELAEIEDEATKEEIQADWHDGVAATRKSMMIWRTSHC